MLQRKMFRDIREIKGAYLACTAIIVIGLLVFTAFSLAMDNLRVSQAAFYREHHFADGFATVRSMPYNRVAELGAVPGIDTVQGRLVQDVRVIIPGRTESTYLRLVTLDLSRHPVLNGAELLTGEPLPTDRPAVWVDNNFFAANGLSPGQELAVIIGGARHNLTVAGAARSPEFIYAMRTAAEIFPYPAYFGIAFIAYDVMAELGGEGRVINDIVFTLEPGADFDAVKTELETSLAPYGPAGIIPRSEQLSHLMLTQELLGMEGIARTMPVMFLAVSAVILFITLRRMIERQRGQIGTMKAFGYTEKEILTHYLSYALLIGGAGGSVGGALGILLSFFFTALYGQYFNLPQLYGRISWDYFAGGLLLALGFAAVAGYQGCRGILQLEPAEAMRPPAPPGGGRVWLERVRLFWSALTAQGKIAIRNLMRRPAHTLFLFLGITFTFSLLGLPWSFMDITQRMIIDQFAKVQTYDVKIVLAEPQSQKAVERELGRFPGVRQVETIAEVPVTLTNSWRQQETALTGLPAGSELYHILDKGGRDVALPPEGIVLSQRLAQLLEARVGTELLIRSPLGRDPAAERSVTVTGVVPQYLGMGAYMNIAALQDLLGQGDIGTAVLIGAAPESAGRLLEAYRDSPRISGAESNDALREQFGQMMEMMYGSMSFLLIIGIVTGFAIIYNSSLVTLSEQSRDLATLLVLGMTPPEVLSVITFEHWFIAFWAMLAGIPLTRLLFAGMGQAFNTDAYTLPTEIGNLTFIIAFIFTTAAIWLAQAAAARKIRTLELTEVLRARE
ncbi:MAG: FtsX-like permease family protein [bacterium]|jgi:putative ABC transport system permease protein